MEPLSWKETRLRISADHQRLLSVLQRVDGSIRKTAFLHPSFVSVLLYRLSNYFCRNDCGWLARIVWHLNIIVTGADISQYADIDEGLVVVNPPGVAIMGTVGRNLTVMACAGVGGELGRNEDIGAGPGFSLLGDDVLLEPHSGVLGPVVIGSRVRVGGGVSLKRNVPDDTYVQRPAPRFFPIKHNRD